MNLQTEVVQPQDDSLDTGKQLQSWFLDFLQNKTEIHENKETKQNEERYKYKHRGQVMIEEKTKTLEVDTLDLIEENAQNFQEIILQFYKYEPYLQKAVAELIMSLQGGNQQNDALNPLQEQNDQYLVSFYNYEQNKSKLRKLRLQNLGQLVSFKGTVTRSTDIRPELINGSFQCQLCNTLVKGIGQQFKYTEPKFCKNPVCKNTVAWKLMPEYSVFTDMQKLRLQEDSGDIPPGGMPRSIDVVLRDQICDKVKPGDKVKVTGKLIVIPDIMALSKPGEKNQIISRGDQVKTNNNINQDGITGLKQLGQRDLNYKLGFIGNSIYTIQDSFSQKSEYDQIHYDEEDEDQQDYKLEEISQQFTSQELEQIDRMQKDENIYSNLAKSIAPTVSGSYEIKKGILLMIFGGVHKKTPSGTNLRGDLNVCILGDPSTAKSQFLKYVSNFLPRSVYTSGKSSSAAGLTASVQREPETGEYCVEAGALMLADHGVCCIDEFDKMGLGDQVAIHEAMEQQTISIAKAGIQATLNARASILAAANPINGRYDKEKTLKQNIEMSDPIMSRFDLFFVVLDEQSMNGDKTIANYILNLHQKGEDSLKDNYHYTKQQMQLYLKFCKFIKPHFTPDAAKELESAYIKLRMSDLSSQKSAYKITVRQLESLIRLSEALARVMGDMEIKKSYVQEAYKLLNNSIIKIEKPDQEINTPEEQEQEEIKHQQPQQNIAQEVLEKKQQEEQQKQQRIKLTHEQYISMVQDFVQWFRYCQQEQQLQMEQEQDGELEFGFRAQFAVEKYIERHIDEIEDHSEENIKSIIRICHSVLNKMITTEQILIIVKNHADYKERIVALHDNYVAEQ